MNVLKVLGTLSLNFIIALVVVYVAKQFSYSNNREEQIAFYIIFGLLCLMSIISWWRGRKSYNS